LIFRALSVIPQQGYQARQETRQTRINTRWNVDFTGRVVMKCSIGL
jgi:hypothetical protein